MQCLRLAVGPRQHSRWSPPVAAPADNMMIISMQMYYPAHNKWHVKPMAAAN